MKAIFRKTFTSGFIYSAAALGALLYACGGESSQNGANVANSNTTATSQTCDVSVQPSCPSQVPSYASQIVPIISASCLECHDPNGIGAASTSGAGGAGGAVPHDPNMSGNPNFSRNPNNWDPSDAHDWSKYSNIKANVKLIEQQVFLCNMPPNGATPLADADKQTLLDWLSCGAPNN